MLGATLAVVVASVPPPPPSGASYYLRFTAVRGGASTGELQLAELKLFDLAGRQLGIVGIDNPGGYPLTDWERAQSAVDGNLATKWLDMNISKPLGRQRSLLLLSLAGATPVAAYDLYTANHQPNRDPVTWTFGAYREGAAVPFVPLHRVAGYVPPLSRYTSYTYGAGFTVLVAAPS
eukprot:6012221-Prymnesium_polylepis.1